MFLTIVANYACLHNPTMSGLNRHLPAMALRLRRDFHETQQDWRVYRMYTSAGPPMGAQASDQPKLAEKDVIGLFLHDPALALAHRISHLSAFTRH